MGSNVLSTKQGRYTGDGNAKELFLEGLDVDKIEIVNLTDLTKYSKQKMDPGAACLQQVAAGTTTAIAEDGDGITITEEANGTKVTIAAALNVDTNEFQWFANIN
jgi:hypothetical protein